MKLTVLLDCDGVLADFNARTFQDVVALKGSSEQTHQDWSIEETFGLSSKEKRWLKAQRSNPGWCLSIPPFEKAIQAVKDLRQMADVHIVTSPWMSPHWTHERYIWLKKHFGLSHNDVTFTHQKHRVFGHVFVDDKESHHIGWLDQHPNHTSFLWAQPYNVPVKGSIFYQSMFYTDNWEQLHEYVSYLTNNGNSVK